MSKGLQLLVWWPSRLQSEHDQSAGVITRLHCEVINAAGRVVSHQDCLPSELPRNLPASLLLHPDDVSLLPVNVPDVRGKQAAQALAFATEPLVLADVEDLFISAHAPLKRAAEGSWRTVACVDRMRARAILTAATGLGLDVRRVSCEPLFFDIRGRDVWLLETPAGAWVCSHIEPPWLLDAQEVRDGAQRLRDWLQQNGLNLQQPLLLVSRTPSIRTTWEHTTGMPFEVLGRDALAVVAQPAQLLPEKDMRVSGGFKSLSDSRWRRTAQLGLATAVLALVFLNLAAQRIRAADQALDAAVEAAFARAMPNTPMVADPLIMLERARVQLSQSSEGGSSAFTRLLHASAGQMQNLPFNAASMVQYDGTTLSLSFSSEVSEAQRREIDSNLRGQQIRSSWIIDERKRNRVNLTWVKN